MGIAKKEGKGLAVGALSQPQFCERDKQGDMGGDRQKRCISVVCTLHSGVTGSNRDRL